MCSAFLQTLTLLAHFLGKHDSFATSTLIQWGCSVSQLVESKGGWQWPALHVATAAGLPDIVWLLLLDGADPKRLEQEWSALFLATRVASPEIAELLLDAGAHVDTGLGKETPLMNASSYGHVDVVRMLVTRGANLHAADSQGRTPLHYAAGGGHHAVVRLLLDSGADPSKRDASGYTAADSASHTFDPTFAQLYREWGMPDRYSLERADVAWEPAGDFDYFLSYRHGRFAEIAADLAHRLNERGRTTFIDQRELQVDESMALPRFELKTLLAKAVRRSRTLVFLESYLDRTARPEDGWHSFSWQFFELLHARVGLFVSIDGGYCCRWIVVPGERIEKGPTLFTFRDLSELSEQLTRRDWD